MGLQGQIIPYKNGEKEDNDEREGKEISPFPPPPLHSKFAVVGYALTSKKIKSFLKPKLEGLARNKGILFVAIDQNRPLSDQGPFDIVLHKLTGKEWRQILEVGPILTSLILFLPELLVNSLKRVKTYLIDDLNLRCHMICSSSWIIKNHRL
ncbi:INOSITOL-TETRAKISPHOSPHATE 1-KINASE [Salix purpurea]|uniref:INOSITOL-TETRAKISPHOSPHATE 1-KINASE n=1 Tax=Salix purpurea TaxID=77065 RepID=A0A9Q0USR6_SALPP|nr:INOSITOL-TETRAKISPHOSPHATE 1-KINASE [Salix purpurea]